MFPNCLAFKNEVTVKFHYNLKSFSILTTTSRIQVGQEKGTNLLEYNLHGNFWKLKIEARVEIEIISFIIPLWYWQEKWQFFYFLPRYIMTSEHTKESTLAFFHKHNFFGLKSDDVILFEQHMLPALTLDGKIILEKPYKVHKAPGK